MKEGSALKILVPKCGLLKISSKSPLIGSVKYCCDKLNSETSIKNRLLDLSGNFSLQMYFPLISFPQLGDDTRDIRIRGTMNRVRKERSYGVRKRLMRGDQTAHEMLQYMSVK